MCVRCYSMFYFIELDRVLSVILCSTLWRWNVCSGATWGVLIGTNGDLAVTTTTPTSRNCQTAPCTGPSPTYIEKAHPTPRCPRTSRPWWTVSCRPFVKLRTSSSAPVEQTVHYLASRYSNYVTTCYMSWGLKLRNWYTCAQSLSVTNGVFGNTCLLSDLLLVSLKYTN